VEVCDGLGEVGFLNGGEGSGVVDLFGKRSLR
jgi:hypothetical protein